MGLEAATKALLDAGTFSIPSEQCCPRNVLTLIHKGITYDCIEAAYVGYCYGDSTSGQVSF